MSAAVACTHPYAVADVFTDRPLQGNPVAVFLDASPFEAGLMQRLAREMNLSETVFVLPPRSDGDVRVRIFTPVNELPFAGHPTLGAAIVLGTRHRGDVLRMETAIGTVPFALHRRGGVVSAAVMEQPLPTSRPYERADELLAALDLPAATLPVEIYCNGPRHVLVTVPDVDTLSALHPDHRALASHPDLAVNCLAPAGERHWRMRMFSPAYGVVEDAATGSAAGPVGVHLVRHGVLEPDHELLIEQGVEIGRRSLMHVRSEFDGRRPRRIRVGGSAVVVAHGELELAGP